MIHVSFRGTNFMNVGGSNTTVRVSVIEKVIISICTLESLYCIKRLYRYIKIQLIVTDFNYNAEEVDLQLNEI